MVDLKIFLGRADGAAAVLPLENRGYVVGGKAAAVAGHSCPSIVSSHSAKFSQSFWIGLLPALQHLSNLAVVLLCPALYLCAVAGRVFRSASARGSRFVAGALSKPLLRGDDIAGRTQAALDPSLVVSVRAWLASGVVKVAAFFGGQSSRMPRTFGGGSHRSFTGALSARASRHVPLGEMAFAARLAGEVKAFAGRYCCSPFRGRSHMFTVMTTA